MLQNVFADKRTKEEWRNEISRLNYSYITNQVKNGSVIIRIVKVPCRNIERLATSHRRRRAHIEEQ